LSFGAIILGFGLPTVLYFNYGVFDEYDYWAGTVSLVVFALLEIILFAWIFGMDKAWAEIKSGADIHVPEVYKFIIKYVTPVLLLAVFVGALVSPPLVKKLEMFPEDISQRYEYQAYFDEKGFDLKSEENGRLILSMRKNDFDAKFVSDVQFENLMAAEFNLQRTDFKLNDFQEWGVQLSNIFKGKAWEFDNSSIVAQVQNKAINDRLSVSTDAQEIKELKKKRKFVNLARGLLLFMFFGIAFLVYLAYMKRQRAL
jgi:nitrogen fixation/metabolism regulation signal transduction histidine kinase